LNHHTSAGPLITGATLPPAPEPRFAVGQGIGPPYEQICPVVTTRDGNSTVIITEPTNSPVTIPVLAPTSAELLLLVQLELVVKSSTEPSSYVACAYNGTVLPSATENELGDTVWSE
jgi:hypothetical protein